MFFKRAEKTENELKGLYADLGDLIAQRKFLPYIRRRHNNVTSCQAGDIRSAFKGRGMELEEVRAYGYGDDVRDIDWRVTARKGDTYTKVFSEEKDREVYVVLDMSPYMVFGTRKELKSVAAAKVAALLGWQSLTNKDRFGVLIYDGYDIKFFKPQNNQKNLMAVFKAVSETSYDILYQNKTAKKKKVEWPDALLFLQYNLKSRATVFVVSDFNTADEKAMNAIMALSRKSAVFCANVYDLLEESAPDSGEYQIEYENERLMFSTASENFRKIYASYFAEKRKNMETFCKRFNCHYLNIRTDLPLHKQLKLL